MNQRIISCQIKGEQFMGSGVVAGAEGSGGDVVLQLEFGEMWEGLVKYATFRNALGEEPVVVALTTDLLRRLEGPVPVRKPAPECPYFPGGCWSREGEDTGAYEGQGGRRVWASLPLAALPPRGASAEQAAPYGAPGNGVSHCGGEEEQSGLCDDEVAERLVYHVPIPAQAKAVAGQMMVTVQGYSLNADGSQVETATMTATAYFRILPAAYAMPEDKSITPTLSQQLQAQIEDIRQDIVDAAKAADAKEAARESAEEAKASAAQAKMSEEAAVQAQANAEFAQIEALNAMGGAELYQRLAETAQAGAEKARAAAESAQVKAQAAQAAAEDAQTGAEGARGAAELAQAGAETAEGAAQAAQAGAQAALGEAERAAAQAQEALGHQPVIEEGTWRVWDAEREAYQDTGTQAQGPQGETGPQGEKGDPGMPPAGGITGQVYTKLSAAEGDAGWKTPEFVLNHDGTAYGWFTVKQSENDSNAGIDIESRYNGNVFLQMMSCDKHGTIGAEFYVDPYTLYFYNTGEGVGIDIIHGAYDGQVVLLFASVTGGENETILRGLCSPEQDNDAATKGYVDRVVAEKLGALESVLDEINGEVI